MIDDSSQLAQVSRPVVGHQGRRAPGARTRSSVYLRADWLARGGAAPAPAVRRAARVRDGAEAPAWSGRNRARAEAVRFRGRSSGRGPWSQAASRASRAMRPVALEGHEEHQDLADQQRRAILERQARPGLRRPRPMNRSSAPGPAYRSTPNNSRSRISAGKASQSKGTKGCCRPGPF